MYSTGSLVGATVGGIVGGLIVGAAAMCGVASIRHYQLPPSKGRAYDAEPEIDRGHYGPDSKSLRRQRIVVQPLGGRLGPVTNTFDGTHDIADAK